ncbi:addiction module antitoxin [Wenzhouxiangella sp. XN79A]|uniref:ribbon-helix-helix domain-containing protein n=1 Tax=Wenzhouxiangella sp. XN79A TaxID=2724193 RepID=UPI00144ABA38|nr:addiction module antitoxin [Wenzhouxiangella sp. XN79A]NKI33854.1 addiction module antitoxin [Wenzhouxiangella sp. XN79A]
MTEKTTLTVRLSGALSRHVADAVGEESGAYENVSEYVRDLIRRDMQRTDEERFERLKSELQLAFAQPESSYQPLSAEDIIRRNSDRG